MWYLHRHLPIPSDENDQDYADDRFDVQIFLELWSTNPRRRELLDFLVAIRDYDSRSLTRPLYRLLKDDDVLQFVVINTMSACGDVCARAVYELLVSNIDILEKEKNDEKTSGKDLRAKKWTKNIIDVSFDPTRANQMREVTYGSSLSSSSVKDGESETTNEVERREELPLFSPIESPFFDSGCDEGRGGGERTRNVCQQNFDTRGEVNFVTIKHMNTLASLSLASNPTDPDNLRRILSRFKSRLEMLDIHVVLESFRCNNNNLYEDAVLFCRVLLNTIKKASIPSVIRKFVNVYREKENRDLSRSNYVTYQDRLSELYDAVFAGNVSNFLRNEMCNTKFYRRESMGKLLSSEFALDRGHHVNGQRLNGMRIYDIFTKSVFDNEHVVMVSGVRQMMSRKSHTIDPNNIDYLSKFFKNVIDDTKDDVLKNGTIATSVKDTPTLMNKYNQRNRGRLQKDIGDVFSRWLDSSALLTDHLFRTRLCYTIHQLEHIGEQAPSSLTA